MSDQKQIICRRCLLAETGQAELIRSLEELKAAIPEEDKISNTVYQQRLDICRQCDELINGTCQKCGCYAEFRALKKLMSCPHEDRKW